MNDDQWILDTTTNKPILVPSNGYTFERTDWQVLRGFIAEPQPGMNGSHTTPLLRGFPGLAAIDFRNPRRRFWHGSTACTRQCQGFTADVASYILVQTIQIFTLGADSGRGLFFPSGFNASAALNGTSKQIQLYVPPYTLDVSLAPSPNPAYIA